jgi:hypothetical protein
MRKKSKYATIQIDRDIKDIVVKHCDSAGMKIGRYIERLVAADYSGSFKQSQG